MSSGFWIGFWIFLTAVLVLLVFHRGFRRFAAWAAGGCAVLAAVGALVWWYHTRLDVRPLPVPACGAPGADPSTCATSNPFLCAQEPTHPGCPVPQSDLPVPQCGSEGADPKTCATSNPIICDMEPTHPGCPVPQSDIPKIKWDPPPGFTLDCPAGTQPARDNLTGKDSCYNSRDTAQLKEHLAECALNINGPYPAVTEDRGGVPCDAHR